jgi:rare lipoprotein A (peptidoglycan hydrolase)
VPGTVVDRYGEQLSRWEDCKQGGAGKTKDPTTVVVKIVDACPCQHSNYASNQRWCCGDVPHIDLGAEAFNLLADKSRGVVRVRWRKVDCDKGNGAVAPSSVV